MRIFNLNRVQIFCLMTFLGTPIVLIVSSLTPFHPLGLFSFVLFAFFVSVMEFALTTIDLSDVL